MANKAPGNHERQGVSVLDLFKMFPNESSARKWFENIRWKNERHCPHCGSLSTIHIPKERPMPYHCRDCKQYFSIRTNTVMQSSRLPLQKWVIGIYLMSTNLKGVSSMKLHRDLGITQKSAWLLAQKIRQGFINGSEIKMFGSIEVDETYIGGLEKNKHASKRLKQGRGAVGKTAVIGAKQRDGMIIAQPIENTNRYSLHRFIDQNIQKQSSVYTDEFRSYRNMQDQNHFTVNHSVGKYVDGQAHTNGIESFWSMLKRGYHGTYHKISHKHLHRYVNEFVGRHNIRQNDTIDQMAIIFSNLIGKTLPYKVLTV